MNKRVTIVVAVMFVFSITSFAPALAGTGAGSSGEEKNVKIKIIGEGNGDETDDCLMIKGGDDIKVIKSGDGCGFIGINMEDLSEALRKKHDYPKETGVLVTGIVENSAAEKYGLKKDDIIYMFDGNEVTSSKQLADLVMKKKSGDTVHVVFYRGKKKKEMDLELGERKYEVYSMDWEKYGSAMEKYARAAALAGADMFTTGMNWIGTRGRLGLVLKDLNEDLAPYFEMEAGGGILVIDVVEDSPAEGAGVKSGDVIVKVGEDKVAAIDELMDKIHDCAGEGKVNLVVVRKGEKKNIDLEIDDEMRFKFMPAPRVKKIEIPEDYEIEVIGSEHLSKAERMALEKEIEVLKKEIEKLEKRLEKVEKK
jgi:C-terminal processing protease CtpA/Prc